MEAGIIMVSCSLLGRRLTDGTADKCRHDSDQPAKKRRKPFHLVATRRQWLRLWQPMFYNFIDVATFIF